MHSIHSDWVLEEAAEARDHGILIPVLLEKIKQPLGFRSIQYVDFTTQSGGSVQALVMSISLMLDGKNFAQATASMAKVDNSWRYKVFGALATFALVLSGIYTYSAGLQNSFGPDKSDLLRTVYSSALSAVGKEFAILQPTALKQLGSSRIALVVGAGSYDHAPGLVSPAKDVEEITTVIRRVGFRVLQGIDLDAYSFRRIVNYFGRLAKTAEVTLIFYSGHAVAVNGTNYLIPTDANLQTESDLQQAFALNSVVDAMRGSNTCIILINTKSRGALSGASSAGDHNGRLYLAGLALRECEEFSLFSGGSKDIVNGVDPFVSALVDSIGDGAVEIRELGDKVIRSVSNVTDGQQRPFVSSSIKTDFYFLPGWGMSTR
jgi:hypothetical protein